MDKNYKLYQSGKLFIIMVLIFLVLGIICFFVFKTGRIYDNKDIVYTTINKENRLSTITVPAINLKGDDVKKINKELKRVYENNRKYYVSEYYYDYEVDDDILNLVTLTRNIDRGSNGKYIDTYTSYFIDTRTSKTISVDKILKRHNLTKEQISEEIDKQVKEMYQKEIEDGFISEYSCSINCFKEMRNMDTTYENLTIGLKNDKIVVYLPFYTSVEYGNDYTKDDFLFKIEK